MRSFIWNSVIAVLEFGWGLARPWSGAEWAPAEASPRDAHMRRFPVSDPASTFRLKAPETAGPVRPASGARTKFTLACTQPVRAPQMCREDRQRSPTVYE